MGRRCRQVLLQLDRHPGKWVRLASSARTEAEASSLRRAAHTLERRGLVDLRKRRDARGTWLVARRRSEETIPDGLSRIIGPDRARTVLDARKVLPPEEWRRRLDGAEDFLKEELWQRFLLSGLTIDEALDALTRAGGARR